MFSSLEPVDIKLPETQITELFIDKHLEFIAIYGQGGAKGIDGVSDDETKLKLLVTEYLRLSGVFWGVSTLGLLDSLLNEKILLKNDVINYTKSCQKENGGFGASPTHEAHVLHTLSAVQILVCYGIDTFNWSAVKDEYGIDLQLTVDFLRKMRRKDGSYRGQMGYSTLVEPPFGGSSFDDEVDTRFCFVAMATLKLLVRDFPKSEPSGDISQTISFIMSCRNHDGGFGTQPGAESHAGQVYCCIGTLVLLDSLKTAMPLDDFDVTAHWLSERQLTSSGGLNGRPEKLPDVCYSWWVMSSLAMMQRLHWLDSGKIRNFILQCQDSDEGGFTDRPGDYPDPYHTLFAIAGLSLLQQNVKGQKQDPPNSGNSIFSVLPVNPVLCMPEISLEKLSIVFTDLS